VHLCFDGQCLSGADPPLSVRPWFISSTAFNALSYCEIRRKFPTTNGIIFYVSSIEVGFQALSLIDRESPAGWGPRIPYLNDISTLVVVVIQESSAIHQKEVAFNFDEASSFIHGLNHGDSRALTPAALLLAGF
jgi:hypothetical protein